MDSMKTVEVLEKILAEVSETTVALDTREETHAFEDGMRYVRLIVERYLKIEKGEHKCKTGIDTPLTAISSLPIVQRVMKIMRKERQN